MRTNRIGKWAGIVFGALMLAGSAAHASGVSRARITELANVRGNGMIWVRFDANMSGTPGCVNAGWENYFAFDSTTTQGTRLLSNLTAAMMAGKPVDASGEGTCVNVNGLSNGNVEQFRYLKIYVN